MKYQLRIFIHCCLLSLIMVGCGAKDEEPIKTSGNLIIGQETDDLKDQTPICYDTNKNCPSYVAKIVSMKNGATTHCTGILVNSNTMMTSATCLPPALRAAGKDCSKAIHIFFPETKNFKAARYYCQSIVNVSALDDNKDPSQWQNNMALIRISDSVSRDAIRPVNAGMPSSDVDGAGKEFAKVYDLWKVSTEIENGTTSFIKHFTCNVIKESYANPFNDHQYSANSAIGNCFYRDASDDTSKEETSIYDGSEGGLVLLNGKFTGMLGQLSITKEAFAALQDQGIVHPGIARRPMNFATNMSCIGEFWNGVVPSECQSDLSDEQLIAKRKAIATSNEASGLDEAKSKIRVLTQLDSGSHLRWETQFSSVKNQQMTTKHIPLCFYKTDQWLKKEFHRFILGYKTKEDTEMSIAAYTIDIKLDGLLKPRAQYKTQGTIKYAMTIRPRDISKNKASEVNVKGSFQGADFSDPYPAIPICP
ncbi:MAG: trypsin-like serine protease [Bacteriovoracaceae bacterium]